MSHLQLTIMGTNKSFPAAPGFLELLAVNVLNLYRMVMVSRKEPIPLVQQMRHEFRAFQPGDIVLELSGCPPYSRQIGLLEGVVDKENGPDLAVIQDFGGNYKAVQLAEIIKIPRAIMTVP